MTGLRKLVVVLLLVVAQPVLAGTLPNGRIGPDTIPGFFDTKTGRFSPLISATPDTGRPVSGDYNILPDFRFDPDFSKDDTIFCDARLTFGNIVHGQLYPNHTAQVSVNFAAGDPDKLITIPYSYTIDTSKAAQVYLYLSCRGFGDSGTEHSSSVYYPVEDVPDGDITQHVTDDL